MKRCRYCGTENDDNDNFCLNCGKSLSEYVNNSSSTNDSGKQIRKFVNFVIAIPFCILVILSVVGVPFCYFIFSIASVDTNSCETILEQIVYLVDRYGLIHLFGTAFLIGITILNFCILNYIRMQLTKIRNVLEDKNN